ncbi:MAG: adenylate/guanylate cyclase domain-containing response regulator [Verrucomicrobiota bacterium]|nr:adenylate/guanylate cyclase domain-containing response regulator [Verrucomicrobiota bacterium]
MKRLTKPLDETEVLLRIKNLIETRFLHLQLCDRNQALRDSVQELEREREISERLLLNILPISVAQRLKQQEQTIADSFSEATVLFADIVDFTSICARLTPEELVGWLNGLFSVFDQLTVRHGLEKIKTIGDSYMVAGGLPSARDDHAEAVADFALDLREAIATQDSPVGLRVELRIGLHTGHVVAGVIGTHKFSYDLWGETVNIASRMQSHGLPGVIQVSEATYLRLCDQYNFAERGTITVKGQRTLRTYLLEERKEAPSSALAATQ